MLGMKKTVLRSTTQQNRKLRTRSDPAANGAFGRLQNRVNLAESSLDNLHRWQKKIPAGSEKVGNSR